MPSNITDSSIPPFTLPPTSTFSSSLLTTTSEDETSTPTPEASTEEITSTITKTNDDGEPTTVLVTSVITPSTSETPVASTSAAALQPGKGSEDDGGFPTGGKIALAVVIPVVVVALLVFGGIFLWRRHKQKKDAEEARRKEVEDYSYNPNNDPTLPPMGGAAMTEDSTGYRGWGSTTNPSNRKTSTTLSGGLTAAALSDNSSHMGYAAHSPNSPTQGTTSDAHSADPLVGSGGSKRDTATTTDSEGLGALGSGPAAGANRGGAGDNMRRGPSNASSSYSAANRSDNSGEGSVPRDFYGDGASTGYYNHGGSPFGADGGASAGAGSGYAGPQPVVQDVSARRNTRIESPTVFPQQGNAGISQNF